MRPLHDYLAKQLAEKLKSKKIVIWYDARREFAPFVDEVRGHVADSSSAVPVTVAGVTGMLTEYTGSFFELRTIVEPYVSGDDPQNLIVYLPGCTREAKTSVLLELEKASEVDGSLFGQALKKVARQVLRQRYTDGVIDEMLAPERVTYEDLARASSDTSSAEPASILKSIFHDTRGNDELLAAWVVNEGRDSDIQAKEATRELTKLVRSRLGLELPADVGLPKLRSITLRYVLAGEFRSDLSGPPPSSVDAVPTPATKDEETGVRDLAKRLRTTFPELYPSLADRVEDELGLRNAKIDARALGSIDTFRFEERTLLAHCGQLVAAQRFDEAFLLVREREHSFWLDRDVGRKAQWEACRRMADLGAATLSVRSEITSVNNGPSRWVESYTRKDGWYRLDLAQRRLETWVANLEEEPEERALGVVRRSYDDTCTVMAEGFTKALRKANWSGPTGLHQTHIFGEVVSDVPKPVAYFFVDAMRFEMGMELAERLPKAAEVVVRAAMGSIPGITPVGMAALLPGASSSFSVIEQNERLGVRIDDTFLPDLGARKKFAAARVPGLVDFSLDELLSLQTSKLAKRVESAQVVVVRSQEIDHAGEAGFTRQARRIMDEVIGDIASAIHRLAKAGIEHSVVTADHGHLFFPVDRDESMRTDGPGGDQVELHRRCWIGRGGATPPGSLRIAASSLGYASDLEFVFPTGCGVFKAGGDLAFHHGGLSLQELMIPVLTVRLKLPDSARPSAAPFTVSGLPEAITNRIFSVKLQLGGQNLSLFAGPMLIRPLLMASGKQVGVAGMAIDAELDRTTGCVTLQPGKPITVAFLLGDETVPSLRVVVQDPTTDAELYRSPTDIPVRLGV